jgi:diacylglycerol kinase family enzyme
MASNGIGQSDRGEQTSMPMDGEREHLFIINPRSFRLSRDIARIQAEIESCLDRRGERYTIRTSNYSREAIGIIRDYLDNTPSTQTVRVYAIGGDGILFDCLNGMQGAANAELAAVPYGRSNDFVRAFGENQETLFRDIAKQVGAPTTPVDIIHSSNNCAILNFVAIGVESAATYSYMRQMQQFESDLRLPRFLAGRLYDIHGFKEMFNTPMRTQPYVITLDDSECIKACGGVNLANGPCYGFDKQPNYRAVPNDGYLDFLFLRATSSLRDVFRIPGYLAGKAYERPDLYIYRRVKKVEIHSEQPLLLNLDGEAFFDIDITFEVQPGALRFVTPNGLPFEKKGPGR